VTIAIFDVSGTLHEDCLGAAMYGEFYEMFKALKAHHVQIALATNLSRSGLNYFIKNNELVEWVDEDICLSEAAPKPNNEMLKEILLRTGKTAEDGLMIGDGVGDMIMAKSINMKCCAVNWSSQWSYAVLEQKPDYKVEKIAGLWQVFEDVFKIKK
jgi:phosphoglycolate phosphatase-like HAD superfamily hydrolase